MAIAKGAPFHGEFSSADATALTEPTSRVLLYVAGTTTAITLLATDFVCITDIVIVCASGMVVTLYDGADTPVGAGEVIVKGTFGANGGVSQTGLLTPHYCQVGTWPKLKSTVGAQVDCYLHGNINSGTL